MRKLLVIAIASVFLFSIPMMAFAGPPMGASAEVKDVSASAGASANGYNNGQGQDQGQQQGQSTMLNDIGNIKDSFNSQGMRGYAIPGEVMYGPLLQYYQPGTASGSFQRVENLLLYTNAYTEGALESILKNAEWTKAEIKVTNNIELAKPAKQDGKTRFIVVVVTMPDKNTGQLPRLEGVKVRGFVNAWSKNQHTTMDEVMAAAALKALKAGCNVIQFIAQGASRDTISNGWGVGFSFTSASISGGQGSSSNGTLGIGYSHGEAGMRDKPWLQAYGLVDPDLVEFPGELFAESMPEEEQTGNHRN